MGEDLGFLVRSEGANLSGRGYIAFSSSLGGSSFAGSFHPWSTEGTMVMEDVWTTVANLWNRAPTRPH